MTIPIEQANGQLGVLLERLARGERIVITVSGTPVADLVPHANGTTTTHAAALESDDPAPRRLGLGTGTFRMSDDFDAPLEEFREYTE